MLQKGELIAGRYMVLGGVGEGAMSQVYEVEERGTGRIYAAKVLRANYAHDEELRARFEREAKILARLDHPHIVAFVDVLEQPLALIQQYIAGESLASLLTRCGQGVGAALAVDLLKQIASALVHAHEQGVVHRDLKPGNILLERTGHRLRAYVGDFGLAKLLDLRRTQTGDLLGTIDYMAPEQVSDSSRVDARVDVYAAGVVFFQCLSGRLPFSGASFGEQLLNKSSYRPPPLSRNNLEIPELLDRIIENACAPKAHHRYPNMGALLHALEAAAPLVGPPGGHAAFDTAPLEAVRRTSTSAAVRVNPFASTDVMDSSLFDALSPSEAQVTETMVLDFASSDAIAPESHEDACPSPSSSEPSSAQVQSPQPSQSSSRRTMPVLLALGALLLGALWGLLWWLSSRP